MVVLKTMATNTRLFFLIQPIGIYRIRCIMSREKPMAVNMASCSSRVKRVKRDPSGKRTWNFQEVDSGVQENIEETEGAFVGFLAAF